MTESQLDIYTDGACEGNQFENNYGGWGVIITQKNQILDKISGAAKQTTNNRMEMLAIIKALEYIQKHSVQHPSTKYKIYTDSAYIVNCIHQQWYVKWQNNGWKTAKGSQVKNKDLWQTLLKKRKNNPNIEFIKIKGHAGHKFNELADKTAVDAIHHQFR